MNFVTTFVLLIVIASSQLIFAQVESNINTLRYDAEVNIGVLVNLHSGARRGKSADDDNQLLTGRCSNGALNADTLQQVVAAKWAVDVINAQSGPNDLKIGVQLHDACDSISLTRRHLYSLITATREVPGGSAFGVRISGPPLLGVIGIGKPVELSETKGALHAFNIPLITVGQLEHAKKFDNILSTAPDILGQAKALAAIIYEMSVDKVALITQNEKASVTFLSEASEFGIGVTNVLELKNDANKSAQALAYANGLDGHQPVIVLILDAFTILDIAETIVRAGGLSKTPIWIIASVGLRHMNHIQDWKHVYNGGIVLEPYLPELDQFHRYFQRSLEDPRHSMKSLLNEYKSLIGRGSITIDPQVANIVKGVSALTAAFRLVQLDRCSGVQEASCLRQLHSDRLHEAILVNLKKLSFTTMGSGQIHDDHPNHHHFTPDGRLVSSKRLVYLVDEDSGLDRVGWYSDSSGLHIDLEESPAYDDGDNELESRHRISDITERPRSAPLVTYPESQPSFKRPVGKFQDLDTTTTEAQTRSTDILSRPVFSYKEFISRTWALVVLTVAILGFCISMWMLMYVLIKICDGTLGGQQAMGLMLMIGVTGLFGSVIPWLLPPNEMSCAARHFLHPLLLSLCFSVLLVKAMQLRSFIAVGLGGRIPQINQLVSLLFMVIVQVVISSEWYMMSKPIGHVATFEVDDSFPKCDVSRNRFLILHSYPAALLIISFCYGVSVLKIKTNFHEGRWITAASISMLPIYAVWMLICYCAPAHFHDPATSTAIIVLALMILFIVFIPKMYTINRQIKLDEKDALFYGSKPNSINDSTLHSSNSYGYSPQYKRMARGSHAQKPIWRTPKNKVVHIHGTNGARFNGFVASSDPASCSYEEWHNPTSIYNTSRRCHNSSKDFHAVHLGTNSNSRSSKERSPPGHHNKRSSRSNSKSSSRSSPSYGCTVKGTSAIVLTPDSIVYNDDGIWAHRYDTSPRH